MTYTKEVFEKKSSQASATLGQIRQRAVQNEEAQRAAKTAATRRRASRDKYRSPHVRLEFSDSFDPRTAHLIYEMQPLERASLVKAGAPSSLLSSLSLSMEVPKERLVKILGLSRSTVARKIAGKADFSMDESERVVGLVKLVGQVGKMVMESGDPEGFDAAKWFGHWIEQPESALAGKKPSDLMDSSDGREAVSRLLSQMQSGAYA